MPSNPNRSRPSYRPGFDFDQLAIPVTTQPQRTWFRVHRSGSPAVNFGILPHHRFSHSDSPFRLLYLGDSIQTCLWEYFGDDVFQGQRVISSGKWNACTLSQIVVPQLKLCALTQAATRDAMGVDKASLIATDLNIPQAWGLALQKHPSAFEAIKDWSRFNNVPCLVLLDRGGMASRLQAKSLGDLNTVDAAADWLDQRKAALV